MPLVFLVPYFFIKLVEPFMNVRIEIKFKIFVGSLEYFFCNGNVFNVGSFRLGQFNLINQIVHTLLNRALSHAGLKFLQEISPLVLPLVINVSLSLKPNYRNRS